MIDRVKNGLITHLTTLFGPPFGEVHREPWALWLSTGDPDPYRNGVLDAIPGDGGEVDRLLAPFRELGLPMMWWFFTGPGGLEGAVHRLLLGRGLTLDSDRPAMTLDLTRLTPVKVPDGLEVRLVRTEAEFNEWLDVGADAFETADRHTSISTQSFRRWGFGPESPFRHFISSFEEIPVGTATMSWTNDVASFGNIGTRRAFRRRGIARATLGVALAHARDMGLTGATLSADPDGTLLYRALGFETVGRHLTYVWKP